MTTEPAAGATATEGPAHQENSAYELFMGVLSILSLIVMAWLFLARDEYVSQVLIWVDLMFSLIFLGDFVRSFWKAPVKRAYLWPRGLLDLLSSFPGVLNPNLAILRVFRLFRIARVWRILQVGGPRKVLHDFLAHREQSAVYLIVLAVILVITLGSIGEVFFEADAPDANITTAGDAIWWAFTTITTVGYGDQFPVTPQGRVIAVLTMATGIAIFGVVTSLLSSFILGGNKAEAEGEEGGTAATAATGTASGSGGSDLATEIADLRAEIASLRAMLEQRRADQ